MEMFIVIAKSLVISFGICAVALVIILVFMMFWVRKAVQDRVYSFILSGNRQLRGKLVKPDADDTFTIGDDADSPKYLTHSSKQFWSFWPPGLPRFVQEPVPTLLYVAGNAEPLDPYDRTSLISPEALRKISDEAMLKQTWRDVRETLGIRAGFSGNKLLLVLVLVAVVASGIAAYLSFNSMNLLDAVAKALGVN